MPELSAEVRYKLEKGKAYLAVQDNGDGTLSHMLFFRDMTKGQRAAVALHEVGMLAGDMDSAVEEVGGLTKKPKKGAAPKVLKVAITGAAADLIKSAGINNVTLANDGNPLGEEDLTTALQEKFGAAKQAANADYHRHRMESNSRSADGFRR